MHVIAVGAQSASQHLTMRTQEGRDCRCPALWQDTHCQAHVLHPRSCQTMLLYPGILSATATLLTACLLADLANTGCSMSDS